MLDKYFGFLKIHDEVSVVDTFLEWSRIDHEKLILLKKAISAGFTEPGTAPGYCQKIRKIAKESSKLFENTSHHIIQASFDPLKQVQLLTLFQIINQLASQIIEASHFLEISLKLNIQLPVEVSTHFNALMEKNIQIHSNFDFALNHFLDGKKDVLKEINEAKTNQLKSFKIYHAGLEAIFLLGNHDQISAGSLRAIERLFQSLIEISKTIAQASSKTETLLIS